MLSFLKNMFKDDNRNMEIVQALQAGAIVLDVRTPSEFQSGHVAGSKNIPLNEVDTKTEAIRKWKKPIITVCHSGNRSNIASTLLRSAGIEAYNGGAWSTLDATTKD
ncbi:rhodanese-like domain-containing protein [Paracnuella aquatica]|uniref:rhodanese-like domain-containing protein n=1 Tax=Paracnuella aquatica TaxID=2268757 RepID=UPI000DEEF516|nr:rhodanese-like domain-containing protein [Paracnuella aquatica]RPD51167.1 rhodanese-like domain-containing protein [Paracnuella aquatica]